MNASGNTETFAERVRLMEKFLSQKLLLCGPADPFAGTIAIVLRRAQGRVGDPWARDRVSDIAFQTGLSVRQFERRFREYTGVAPIVFSRIARFQEALRLKKMSPEFRSWIAVAHTLGYHDQMHMTRDFYGLAGDDSPQSRYRSSLTRTHHERTHSRRTLNVEKRPGRSPP